MLTEPSIKSGNGLRMKNLCKKLFIFVFFTLAFSSVSELKAQSQSQRSPAQSVEAAVNRSLETRTRSIELERIKNEAERDIAAERPTAKKFPEIKEDFEKLQTVNFNSLQTTVLKANPDYKIINKAATEIKKRANRLRKSLFPEDLTAPAKSANNTAENAAHVDLSKADLKQLSILLDNSIYRFVSSNLFQNTNVVNLDDSIKAQNELKEIIKICTLIEDKSKNSF